MKQIILTLALIGYISAAKLDHLVYLPPHNRPAPGQNNQDAGLEAPSQQGNQKSSQSAPSFSSNFVNQPSGNQYQSQPAKQSFNGNSQQQQPSVQGFGNSQSSSSHQSQNSAFPAPASQKYTAPSSQTAFGHSQAQSSAFPAPVSQSQTSAFSAPSSQKYTAPFPAPAAPTTTFGGSQSQPNAPKFNFFSQPQPSPSYNQKTPFGVESGDDSVSIDAPAVAGNNFGLPNPGRQYLSPFGSGSNQQKTSSFGSFSGPAKLQSIFENQKPSSFGNFNMQPAFGSQKSSQPSLQGPASNKNNQYIVPAQQINQQEPTNGFGNFHAPSQPTQNAPQGNNQPSSNFGSYQGSSQPTGSSGNFASSQASQGAPQPAHNGFASSQVSPQQSAPSHGNFAPSQPAQSAFQPAQKFSQPSSSFGSFSSPAQQSNQAPQTQGSYEGPANQNQPSQQAFKQPFGKSSQTSAPYQYNKPTPSFVSPSFGGNSAPNGNTGFPQPQTSFNAQPAQNGPVQGFGHQSSSGSNGNFEPQGQNQGPQNGQVPQNNGASGQYPMQAQDENGGYIY